MTTKEQQLKEALRANGISPIWAKWADTQGLGAAIREALRGAK